MDGKRSDIRATFKQIIRLEVDRHDLFNDILTKYDTFITCDSELRVKFKEEEGVGIGVCRDMFSAFWEMVEIKFFEGRAAKVPIITPDNSSVNFIK